MSVYLVFWMYCFEQGSLVFSVEEQVQKFCPSVDARVDIDWIADEFHISKSLPAKIVFFVLFCFFVFPRPVSPPKIKIKGCG